MIKMKRTYLLVLILFLSVSLSAQKDKQAREILDKTANALQQAGASVPPLEEQAMEPYC